MSNLVLLVEDEALLARNIKTYLERREYEVAIAGTLRQGRQLYDELKPDAMFGNYDLAWRFGVSLGIVAGIVQIVFGGPSGTRSGARPLPATG